MQLDQNNLLKVLSEFVSYAKRFNQYVTDKYKLSEAPFNAKGRIFPGSGVENIDNVEVTYKFHGQGCSLNWSGIEISFDIDVSTIHEIMISNFEVLRFIRTNLKFKNSIYANYSYGEMNSELEKLAAMGVLMARKPAYPWCFHVNQQWYESYEQGREFTGDNSKDIDQI